jgi:hypothetical protein
VQNAKLIAARPMMIRMKMYPAPIKDHYFLSTILKINDTMDKNYKDKAEKEPGFNRLEEHRKNLILNATATPPFDEKASQPTEFFTAFLSKKSQFKAKDMLVHRLQSEKICFNPGSSFVNNLWNCDLFWLLLDSPSGDSIFFCPETKSANASDIEKDRLLALADKVPLSNIEKLSKQKIYIPNTLMEMVWMAQNFYTVSKLCSVLKLIVPPSSKIGLTTCMKIEPCIPLNILSILFSMLRSFMRSILPCKLIGNHVRQQKISCQ